MKSVVMIAYFFPPEGSAGAHRPLRFVRHLSKMRWSTTVVSADPYLYERYDPDLQATVPSDTEIVRVRVHDPWQAIQAWRGRRIREKLSGTSVETAEEIRAAHHKPFRSRIREAVRTAEAWYYHPDTARPWIRPAIDATVKVCTRKQPNVIWATASPVSSWMVARQVSRQTGVPYVLDLRDPHGLDYYESEVRWPKWVKHAVKRAMYHLLKEARAVVFLFDTVAECYHRAFPGALDPVKTHIIPNGYDGATEEFATPNGNKCTVLYTGTVTTYRYDTLLHSLVLFKKTDPREASRLRLRFVGEGTQALANEAAALGLSDIVEAAGPASYAEILRLQREAHALLVLGRPPTMKGYELVAGAKLFDYLKARRPIVGVLPRDETQKILQGVGAPTVADVDSPSEITAVLRQLLGAWSAGSLHSLVPDRAACEAYSAEKQTMALVRALEGAPAAKPFVPGLVEIPPSLQGEIGIGRCMRSGI